MNERRKRLNDCIRHSGYTKAHMAKMLDMSATTFSSRLRNIDSFRVCEIYLIVLVLRMNPTDRDFIFGDKVGKYLNMEV